MRAAWPLPNAMANAMAIAIALVLVLASVSSASGCIYLTGVQDFQKGACEGNCSDAATDVSSADAGACPAGMIAVVSGRFTPVAGGGIVSIDSLCVDASEVTESAYRACVATGSCAAPPNRTYCNYGIPGRESDPINCVDLTQAKAFCASVDKRLPTEQEWEWIARGGPLGYVYPWGNAAPLAADDPERLCWQGKDKHGEDPSWPGRPAGSCAVKSFASGARDGIFDLAGNVWEWTSSVEGSNFVFRGGSAFDPADPATFRVGSRRAAASAGYPGVGLRCVRSTGDAG